VAPPDKSKVFFFEKKKQKTLFSWICAVEQRCFKEQKFFGSFFQKRTSLLFPLGH
jgi:hypothetical protein